MATTKATITFAPNFNDEGNPTIKYDNPAGKTVTSLQACISLDGSKDDIAYRNINKKGTSYTFDLTKSEREILRGATTGNNSRTVKFIVKTVINGKTYKDTKEKTLKIINCQPTISPEVYDCNEKTVALTGNNAIIVRYCSNVYFNFNWETKKQAFVSESVFKCGSKASYGVNTGVIEAVDESGFGFRVTDSRGNEVTHSGAFLRLNYRKPTCNLSVALPTTEGKTTLTINGTFYNAYFGKEYNAANVYYRYKEESNDFCDWIPVEATVSSDTLNAEIPIEGLDYRKKYTFQAKVADKLTEKASKKKTVKSIPVFDWSESDFNFNVPVNFNDSITVDNTSVNFSGLAKALTNSYTLTTKVTKTNTSYSSSSVSAILVGNELRIRFSATRNTSTEIGNIDNEVICGVEVTHNGKISQAFEVSFASGGTGAVSTFNVANVSATDTSLTFDIQLNATTVAAKNFGSYFTIPITLNLDAY